MRKTFTALSALLMSAAPVVAAGSSAGKPTVVLVHGAFADGSSWNPVIQRLTRDGYPVIAAAVPLRGVSTDAAYIASIVRTVKGPVVLVGHSYGGEVISVAAASAPNVRSLVFVAGFAPERGESAASLGKRFPTGTLGQTLAPPVVLPTGGQDLYIVQSKYRQQFAADVSPADAISMAATQRPITVQALNETVEAAAWHRLPSWFIWGSADRNIPGKLFAFMAKRANARQAQEVSGASHVVMLTHPIEVSSMIERAASGH